MRTSRIALVLLTGALGCGGSAHPPPAQCTQNSTCKSTEVCFDGKCVDAIGPTYHFALSIDVAPTEPDGTAWDGDNSPPDVEAQLTDASAGSEPLASWDSVETFSAAYEPRLLSFDGGMQLQLHVDDADPIGQDFICQVQLPEIRAFLHQGGVDADATSCHVNISVTPIDATPP